MPIYPEFSITMPVSDDMVEKLRSMTADWPVKPKIVTGMMAKYTAFYESDVALCKSGTVTLEVAKCGLPLVMTYRANPISVAIVKRTLITKYFNLINVIQDREVIPERIQTDCTPDKLVAALRTLIDSPPAAEKQKSLCYEALKKMQAPGGVSASELAADTVLGMIKSNAFS